MRLLILSMAHMATMQQHLERCLPLEGCGLLAGSASTVLHVIPVTNGARSPVRFLMEPQEQVRALDWIETNQLELVGIFHSHPAGPDHPSTTDVHEASYPVVQVIWARSQENWRAHGFWIEDGRFSEVKLTVTAGE